MRPRQGEEVRFWCSPCAAGRWRTTHSYFTGKREPLTRTTRGHRENLPKCSCQSAHCYPRQSHKVTHGASILRTFSTRSRPNVVLTAASRACSTTAAGAASSPPCGRCFACRGTRRCATLLLFSGALSSASLDSADCCNARCHAATAAACAASRSHTSCRDGVGYLEADASRSSGQHPRSTQQKCAWHMHAERARRCRLIIERVTLAW